MMSTKQNGISKMFLFFVKEKEKEQKIRKTLIYIFVSPKHYKKKQKHEKNQILKEIKNSLFFKKIVFLVKKKIKIKKKTIFEAKLFSSSFVIRKNINK